MKRNLLLSVGFVMAMVTASFGQGDWSTDFDSNFQYASDRFYFDTISNPNCHWQIGHPNKSIFTSAFSNPNALITDTLNPMPASDTSIIYVKHYRDWQPFHVFRMHFKFQLDGDSTDRGTIEVSPDTGHTWINVMTQDSIFDFNWGPTKPTLTGSSNGWQSFDLDMMDWASGWGTFPIDITADTVLFRFTYFTSNDSILHDGWMIDNLSIEDYYEGIQEIQNDNLISISPNPTDENLFIHKTKNSNTQSIQIFNYTGKLVFENSNFMEEAIDTRQLINGIYLLKYSDGNNYAVKKFVVEH